jgi:hypothetical protein
MTRGLMAMPEQKRQIYVALLGKGNDVWKCVDAIHEGNDAYRIVSEHSAPEERWEYGPGERVRCRATTLPTGERVLVATERLPPITDQLKG